MLISNANQILHINRRNNSAEGNPRERQEENPDSCTTGTHTRSTELQRCLKFPPEITVKAVTLLLSQPASSEKKEP